MHLLSSNPLWLSQQLKRRTNELRCGIIRTNYGTQFAQAASELDAFRRASDKLADGVDDDSLSDTFQKTVHFTTYDSYAPFITKFAERPCKASAIVDLLAPGLPDYLAESSSTSGGRPKTFPMYNYLPEMRPSDAVSPRIPGPQQKRTTASIWFLSFDRLYVEDENNYSISTIYLACGSVARRRRDLHLDPERDQERMGTFILDHAAPYAAGFIKKWRSFLLIHALFSVGSRSLETMSMVIVNTFVDMMRHVDANFDMIVDSIELGTIPDLDGIAEIRQYLEPNISPDPERAAELRAIGRPSSRPGWCGQVWPHLRLVAGFASGSFASSVPLAQWYLGPHTDIGEPGYGSTESWIASSYDPPKLNQFKPNNAILIEFLDDSKGDSISSLAQTWEVELGRRYELVLTTPHGLWRYRLGDMVEIAGFDPTDGTPIIQFVERRGVVRLPEFMITERELTAAISSAPFVNLVDWTATVDDREVPMTVGFFVELADDHVPDAALGAPDELLRVLAKSNTHIAWHLAHEAFRAPTVRLVRSGTFSDFRQLKLDEGSHNLGQIKVPVVLPTAYATWFSCRVVREL